MRKLYVLAIPLIIVSFALSAQKTLSQDAYDPQTETTAEERERIKIEVEEIIEEQIPEIKPNPQRSYCADLWNYNYKKENVEMVVLARGKYDEVVVFKCPDCSLEKEFVDPFLFSESQGKTGMDRIKECGFLIAIFKGARGIREVIRQVP